MQYISQEHTNGPSFFEIARVFKVTLIGTQFHRERRLIKKNDLQHEVFFAAGQDQINT